VHTLTIFFFTAFAAKILRFFHEAIRKSGWTSIAINFFLITHCKKLQRNPFLPGILDRENDFLETVKVLLALFCMTKKIILVIFCITAFSIFGHCQSDNEKPALSHKVGIGGFIFGGKPFYLIASYNWILKKRNEIQIPVYYFSNGIINELSTGAAYNWALIKKERRFNFFISPELNFNYYWYHPKGYPNFTVSKYGYFVCLGLIPAMKISSHFSTAFELKIAHGYQWKKNEGEYRDGEFHSDKGAWCTRLLCGLKLYYQF